MRNFTFLQREFSNTTVKSLFWLTWLLLFGILPTNAQVATNYGFSQLSGTFTPITGGLSLGTETTDDQRFLDPAVPAGGTVTTGVGLPIGFDFTFNGQVYDRVAVNANGWISFGNSSLTPAVNNASTSAYTPLGSTTATTPTHLRNRVSALGADLQAQTGASIRIETIGTAPNRVCVVQWLNYKRFGTSGNFQSLNFQIRLNETTNIVDIVYGTMTFNTTSSSVQVGLGGSLATDFNNRQTTTNWNATTAGTTNAATCTILNTVTAPVSGTTFRWALQSCLSVSSLTASNITSNSATVTWSLSTSNPSNDYQWELRTSGQPGSGATGLVNSGTVSNTTTTANLSGLAPQTEHQFYIRSNCGSEFSSWASSVFTTACAPFVPPTLETFTGTFPPICWSRAQNGTPATGPQGGTVFNWVTRNWRNTANTSNGISAVFNIFSTNRQGWLITPTYNLSSGGFSVFYDVAVTDYFNANPIETDGGNMAIDDEVYFLMSVDDGVTWTTLEIFNQANTPPTAGTTKTYDISTVNSGTVKFAFFATSGPANVVNADYDFFVDNFSVASCLPPTSLITSSLTNSSVNLNWTVSVSNPADGYQWEVRTSGAAGSGATGLVQSGSVGVGITTVAITGLTPSTAYQYYVRSVCSASDNSVWIQGPNFTTLCDLVTEFSQNFDTTTAGTGILPPCWSRSGSSTVANVIGSAAAPFSAPNRLQMSAVFNSTVAYVLMPPVSNLQAETHRLRFRAFSTSASRNLDVGYFTNEADLSTFVLLESIPMPSTTQAVAEEFIVIPTGVPAGVSRLVFRNLPSATGTALIYIDDVVWQEIPTCLNPTTLTASNITHNQAQLQWTANAGEVEWDIKYGAPGFNPATQGTLIAGIFNNPYTLTGLTGSTNYAYYVRAVCDSGSNNVSPWEGPFNFTTKCDPVSSYFSDFEPFATGTNSLPDCWTRIGTSTSTYLTTGSVAPMSPTKRMYMFASGTAVPPTTGYAVLPAFDNLSAGTHRFRFTAYSTSNGASIGIGYLTNPDDPGTFVLLSNLSLPGTLAASAQEIIYEVPNTVPAGVQYLALRNQPPSGASYTIYFDNVAWEPIPSCPNPTAPTASGVTATQATLSWNASVNNTSWEIEYGPTGFTQGSGTIVPASTNPFVLTGLSPTTTYQFYVRGICAGPETSAWSGVASFTTACATFTPFYSENFSTFPPACWSRSDAGNLATGPTGTGAGIWVADGFLNNGTTGAIKVNLYTVNRNAWMISPVIDLTAGGYQVKYDVAASVWNQTTATTMGSDDKVIFAMSVDGGATWTSLEEFNVNNTPTNAATNKVYPLTSTSPNVRFAFYATDGTVDDPQDYDFFIDNFVVETIPQNAPVCATNIQASQDPSCGNFPITITWDAVTGANGYKIIAGTTTGGTDIANNVNLGNVTSFVYNAATASTTYYYTIIPFNAVGDAVGCTEQTFTTAASPCACIPVYSTGVTSGDRIVNFQIAGTTLANNSGSTNTNSYTNYPASLGSNFTATLTEATNYPINVQVGFTNQAFAVWIDFNDNGTFELSERVGFTTTNVTGTTLVNNAFSISIPCGATPGLHKMRVRMVYAGVGNTIDPCSSYSFGEVEDYEVTIAPLATPTGDAVQNITAPNAPDATLANLIVSPSSVTWFASESDALTNTNALPLTTQLVNGASYWAVNIVNGCLSAPFQVTVTVTLGLNGNEFTSLSYYPNPVTDVLNLVNSTTIERVEIYNLLGQQVMQVKTNATQTSVQVGELAKGAYIVKAYADGAEHTFKIVKN